MKKWSMYLLVISGIMLTACSPAAAQNESDLSQRPIRVVATTGMIADAVQHVGGDRVQVAGLMGPGIDPHLYKASEGDVRALDQADVIFYNGLHLEAGMGDVLERMGSLRRTVAVAESLDQSNLIAPPEFAGVYDPHIWFDVVLWMGVVERIRDALIEIDPGSVELYHQNAEAYLDELAELHAYVITQSERVPAGQRVLITAHDAFNYFGRAYGFEVLGLQGISTASEASTADIQELSNFIAERRIPAVFVESSVPRRTIEAVQAAVRAQGFEVNIGGALYSDAMGDLGTEDGTYVGMVRHNIDTIVSALLNE
jgi:manganese/zinc/iron transport system substrate-binding protein